MEQDNAWSIPKQIPLLSDICSEVYSDLKNGAKKSRNKIMEVGVSLLVQSWKNVDGRLRWLLGKDFLAAVEGEG